MSQVDGHKQLNELLCDSTACPSAVQDAPRVHDESVEVKPCTEAAPVTQPPKPVCTGPTAMDPELKIALALRRVGKRFSGITEEQLEAGEAQLKACECCRCEVEQLAARFAQPWKASEVEGLKSELRDTPSE